MVRRLSIGQKAKIKVPSGENDRAYETKIMDISKNKIELDFSFISKDEKPPGIRKGREVILAFEGRNALYKLPVKIISFKRHPILSLVVIKAGGLKRIQRRKYVRVQVKKEIEYREKGENEFIVGLMADVSGGGIKLKIDELDVISEGDVLELKLDPLALDLNIINGKVVRITADEDPDTGEKTYNLGVKFIDLPDQVREEIIEWVFVKQRELRRKGLI